MRAMIYIKSICVGLAFVLGFICLLGALALGISLHLLRREDASFFIVAHFHYFWAPCFLVFIAGFIWAYRHFSR